MNQVAEMLFNQGFQAELDRKFEQALAFYTKAIEKENQFALAFYNRANVCSRLGDSNQAHLDYQRALELDPELKSSYKPA